MKNQENQLPNIVKEYIINMMNNDLKPHIRDNYRDILINIRDISNEAINKYEKDSSKFFKKVK